MYTIDILLLVIKGEGDSGLQGRRLLQKKVYFLSEMMGINLDFSPFLYGPYSSLVAGHLNSLVSHGFLEEKVSDSSERGPFGKRRRHTYFLTNEGGEVWSDIEKVQDFETWKGALDLINKQPISGDYNKLSIAAKAHYIVSWREKVDEFRQVAKKYVLNMSEEDIESVFSFLTELGLVTTEKEISDV